MTDKELAEEYVDTLLNKDDPEFDKFLDENLGDLKLTKKQAKRDFMEKNYFQFYETFLATVEALTENEQLKFYRAICRYGLFDELPDFEGKDKAIFLQIQFAIDNQKKRRLINRKNIQKRYEQLQNTTSNYKILRLQTNHYKMRK